MKSCVFALLLGATLTLSAAAQTHVNPDWAFRWYWSTTESDQGDIIAVDPSGFIYVAGHTDTSTSNTDWVLVKVTPSGDSVWSRIYDSPSDGIDQPEFMGIDDQGYIYVCGQVGRSSLPWKTDVAVVKFDPDGNQVWVYEFNGAASFDDYVEGFGMDSNDNIYVVGYTELLESPSPGREDYLLIKLLPSGDTAWVRTMPTGNDTFDRLYDIAFDDNDNIYVVGGMTNGGNCDIATIKYNQNGDTLWMRLYGSSTGADEQPFGIGVDNNGDVYIGGTTVVASKDFLGIKYDSDGNFIWDYVYDGAGAALDNAKDAACDRYGRLFIIGETTENSQTDILVTCFHNAGGLAWDFQYDSGDDDIVFSSKSLLQTDDDGYVYFGGAKYLASGTTQTLTFKLDQNGSIAWYNEYSYVIPPNSGDFSQIRAVNVDQNNNSYATGYSDGPFANWDLFLLKFSAQTHYSLTPFDIIAPVSGDTVPSNNLGLVWSPSSDPDSGFSVEYQVYLSDSPDFTNPIVSDTLSETAWTNPPLLPEDSTFYWKVVAFNGHAPSRICNRIEIFVVGPESGAGCEYIPGDINGNGSANGIDVTYGVTYLKGGSPPPDTCFDCPNTGDVLLAAMDVNGSCSANGIDVTFFVAYLKQLQPDLLFCAGCPPAP